MRVLLPVACLALLLPQLAPSLGTAHAADLDHEYGAPPPPPPVYYERHVYRPPPPPPREVYDVPGRPYYYHRPYYARPYSPYAGAYRDGFYDRPHIDHPPYPAPLRLWIKRSLRTKASGAAGLRRSVLKRRTVLRRARTAE